jgi:hypothetical protein
MRTSVEIIPTDRQESCPVCGRPVWIYGNRSTGELFWANHFWPYDTLPPEKKALGSLVVCPNSLGKFQE